MTPANGNELRRLPSVDQVWRSLQRHAEGQPRSLVIMEIRHVLEAARAGAPGLTSRLASSADRDEATRVVAAEVAERLHSRGQGGPRRVVNATGVPLHTNLGRAVLAPTAREALAAVAAGYSDLEFNLVTGERGSRLDHVEGLLRELTGAEAALVVNNNAAAVMLALDTLAAGREVIVSRGQLVEIGGAFRVPAVMSKGGARLVEVGTTNKTYLKDYEEAITAETALLLRVHTSNYKVVGFTAEVDLADLVALGRHRGIAVMEDLGSGTLIDLATHGLPPEPTVQQRVKTGPDVVTFSGDKLLGGPQAGIAVGRREVIGKMRSNQLMRALRADKLTLAALVATLRLYLEPGRAEREVPTLAALLADPRDLAANARGLARRLRSRAPGLGQYEVVPGTSPAGGGSLPGVDLPSWLVALSPGPDAPSPQALEAGLRRADPPVIARVSGGQVLLDVRTIARDEFAAVIQAFVGLAGVRP